MPHSTAPRVIQRKIVPGRDVDPETMSQAAARGLATPGRALPYADRIQQAFGRFEIGGIAAHTSGEAAASAADMRAEAYAADGHVVLGASSSLHTVAHEAAHAVQQRAGAAHNASSALEDHADRVADRVVAGQSAEPLLAEVCGPGSGSGRASGAIQRKITFQSADLPTTWKAIERQASTLPANTAKTAKAVRTKFQTRVGASFEDKRFETVWGKVAKDDDSFELTSNGLLDALEARYNRSAKSAAGYKKREAGAKGAIAPLLAHNPDFKFQPSARDPQLLLKTMPTFPWDPTTQPHELTQTHLATVALHTVSIANGIEAQASLDQAGRDVLLSTNKNTTNGTLGALAPDRDGLLQMTAQLVMNRGGATRSATELNDDRITRHGLKAFDELSRDLAPDARVIIPPDEPKETDGRHAELRNESTPEFTATPHHPSSGTKIQCMGCGLARCACGRPASNRMGPAWVTDAALSHQMHGLHSQGVMMSGMTPLQAASVGQTMLTQYQNLPSSMKMGLCETRSGEATTDVRPDSPRRSDRSPEDIEAMLFEMGQMTGQPRTPTANPRPPRSPQDEKTRGKTVLARTRSAVGDKNQGGTRSRFSAAASRKRKHKSGPKDLRKDLATIPRDELLAMVRGLINDYELAQGDALFVADVDLLSDIELRGVIRQLLEITDPQPVVKEARKDDKGDPDGKGGKGDKGDKGGSGTGTGSAATSNNAMVVV